MTIIKIHQKYIIFKIWKIINLNFMEKHKIKKSRNEHSIYKNISSYKSDVNLEDSNNNYDII